MIAGKVSYRESFKYRESAEIKKLHEADELNCKSIYRAVKQDK